MPWSLWLNGLTAISGAVAFARAKMVDWRTAIPLLVITTVVAPLGVWILQCFRHSRDISRPRSSIG